MMSRTKNAQAHELEAAIAVNVVEILEESFAESFGVRPLVTYKVKA